MKMAKVSSVYEGRIVNRGEGGEEDEEAGRSRMARQDAKARIRNFRTNLKTRPVNERKIITRSMASTSLDKQIKEKGNQQDVNKVKEKEKGKQKVQQMIIVEDDDEEEEEEEEEKKTDQTAIEAAEPAGPLGDGRFVGIEDWPMTWSYAEEWLWGGESLGLELKNPNWEFISGVGWVEN